MSVVTISRELGSLGTEIARAVAEKLNYEYIDKEKIAQALANLGLSALTVEKFDEKKPPFWDSMQIQRKKFSHLLQAVITDFAKNGNVVIVGRGGQVILRGLPGVLHVRVMAPFEGRVLRILGQEKMDEKQASRALRRSDRDSAGFLRSIFDVDWNDSCLYDLVINTREISLETGRQLIIEAIHSPEIKAGEKKVEEKLSDLALLQKVEAILMDVVGIDIRHVNVQIEGGKVILRGSVASSADRENCRQAIAHIVGGHPVDNQLLVTQYYRFGA